MKTLKLTNDYVVELYSSIRDLPVEREQEFKKLLLQDSEMGSDMPAISSHYSSLHKFIMHDKKEAALDELVNLHNNLFFIIEGISIKSLCFIALVKSMGGKLLTDLSPENAKKTVKKLSKWGLTDGHVEDIVEEVKKKLISNFNPNFLIDTTVPEMETLL